MFYYLYVLGFVYFIAGLVLLVYQVRHLLSVLICLEIMMFGVLVVIFSVCLSGMLDTLFCLVILWVAVCEGCIGLSLLVLMSRVHGNDYIGNLNSYW